MDSRRKKNRTKIITKKLRFRQKNKNQAVLFFLLHVSTVQFVTTRHPHGSVPVSLPVPEPRRTTDLAVSFYDSKKKKTKTKT